MDDQTLEGSFENQPTLFDPTQKKKKKKSKQVSSEATPETPEVGVTEDLEGLSLGENGREDNENNSEVEEEDNQDAPAQLNFGKKKKKKKKVTFGDEQPEGNDFEKLATEESPWSKTDRDYTYQELLRRIFDFLHGKHPSLAGESRKKFTLRPPQIAREGSKKTVFMNFGDICKSIHRQPEHLLAYMSTEMGTTGNLQEGGRLVLKGRFQPKGIENVLRRYILEYVICKSCRSPESTLMRDANTRLYFLQCESCGATRSVTPIRQGYVAQIGRRKRD
ncbi:Eukaryotic translation initiation factor 2 subunit beta [Galdieria sulphuraria]|nr:Eukaryotic translation initiation factor 2 subunit beta [Galdieria sulphuraria]